LPEGAARSKPFIDFGVGVGYADGTYTVASRLLYDHAPVTARVAAPAFALTLTPGWAWSAVAVGAMLDTTINADKTWVSYYEGAETWVLMSASPAIL
jgi:hypothetical protein